VSGFARAQDGKEIDVQVLGLIIIGIIIGVLARLVLPGRQRIGVLMTVLLGIGGALVGGIVASAIGTGDIWELNILGTIVGVIAAAGLIAGAESMGIGSGGRRDQLGPGR
jgi:uncharacterized membrane protein YeaQ/YmgE (transglycosylase-associated protein family)